MVGGGDIRDAENMRRSFRTRGFFAGGIPRVCTLGWYAMPRQGILTATRGRRGASGLAGTSGLARGWRGADAGLARGSRAYGRPREMGCCQDSRHPVWS